MYEECWNGDEAFTCILPMSNENRTNPRIEMETAKRISATKVLVLRFWPRELKEE